MSLKVYDGQGRWRNKTVAFWSVILKVQSILSFKAIEKSTK